MNDKDETKAEATTGGVRLSDGLGADEIIQMLVKGRPPHSHDRPGFWDGFNPNNPYWQRDATDERCGPNGECFVCQAIIAARTYLQSRA